MPEPARVQLWSRAHCHLCDEARVVVAAVCRALDEPWRECDIDAHPEALSRWSDQVPVLLVDDAVVATYRVDPSRLRAALLHR